MKTWREIQSEVLGLIGIRTKRGTDFDFADPLVAGFIREMPDAYNYAVLDIAQKAAPIVNSIKLSQTPLVNMLGDNFLTATHLKEDIIYEVENPKAYTFEADGKGKVYLEIFDSEWQTLNTITLNNSKVYQTYKGLITTDGTYRLRFSGDYVYAIRNVAFFEQVFGGAETDIPQYTPYNRYNLIELTKVDGQRTFIRIAPNGIRYEGSNYDDPEYRFANLTTEGDSTIMISYSDEGQYEIFYYSLPARLTTSTLSTFIPELKSEALDIIPLYMASRLLQNDNPQLAVQLRNEYYAKREELAHAAPVTRGQKVVSKSGWF